MKCVVTGGTGFLGSHLVTRLLREGHEVRVVSRSNGYDITRIETLGSVFEGAGVVFHLAAKVQSRPGAFEDTNVLGLENVLNMSERHSVEKFIYVSSFTIFGPSGSSVHNENTISERQTFFHGYDQSKYHGYRLVENWKGRVPVNIIFPTVIFGPGPLTEGNLMARLFQRWKLFRVAPLPGYGAPRWNFVYVEDVVDGILKSLQAAAGDEFVLGGTNCSLKELHAAFQSAAKSRIFFLGLPPWLFKSSSYMEDWASYLFGFKPLVLPSTADFFLNNWQFSSHKAQTRLAYCPRSLAEGLELTCRWMGQTGLV